MIFLHRFRLFFGKQVGQMVVKMTKVLLNQCTFPHWRRQRRGQCHFWRLLAGRTRRQPAMGSDSGTESNYTNTGGVAMYSMFA